MRFSSGPIPLYMEFIEVSSCEMFRSTAHRLRRWRRKEKTRFYVKINFLPENVSSAFLRPGIKWRLLFYWKPYKKTFQRKNQIQNWSSGSWVIARKHYWLSRKNEDKRLRNRLWSRGFVFRLILLKLSQKMNIVYAHVKWWKNVLTCWRRLTSYLRKKRGFRDFPLNHPK